MLFLLSFEHGKAHLACQTSPSSSSLSYTHTSMDTNRPCKGSLQSDGGQEKQCQYPTSCSVSCSSCAQLDCPGQGDEIHKIFLNHGALQTAHKEHGRTAIHHGKYTDSQGNKGGYCSSTGGELPFFSKVYDYHTATAPSAAPQLPSSTFVTHPNSVLGNNMQSIGHEKKAAATETRALAEQSESAAEGSPCQIPPLLSAAATPVLSPDTENRQLALSPCPSCCLMFP